MSENDEKRGPTPSRDPFSRFKGVEGGGTLNGALNKEFFALIQASPGIQRKDLVERTGVSGRSADRCIAELVSKGEIERRGSKKTGGYWTL